MGTSVPSLANNSISGLIQKPYLAAMCAVSLFNFMKLAQVIRCAYGLNQF